MGYVDMGPWGALPYSMRASLAGRSYAGSYVRALTHDTHSYCAGTGQLRAGNCADGGPISA